jgi:hypothetical protein
VPALAFLPGPGQEEAVRLGRLEDAGACFRTKPRRDELLETRRGSCLWPLQRGRHALGYLASHAGYDGGNCLGSLSCHRVLNNVVQDGVCKTIALFT